MRDDYLKVQQNGAFCSQLKNKIQVLLSVTSSFGVPLVVWINKNYVILEVIALIAENSQICEILVLTS